MTTNKCVPNQELRVYWKCGDIELIPLKANQVSIEQLHASSYVTLSDTVIVYVGSVADKEYMCCWL